MLEVRDLSVRSARGWPALVAVTIMAHPGEIVAVVGANGAGKTTLLRTIAGLERARTGTIRVHGEPLTALDPRRRAAAGIVYAHEGGRILRGLTVLDNLMVGAWLRRDRAAVSRDLARVFGWFPALEASRRRPAETLSVAGRQALALGRAYLSAPRVLLLDEPLAGLTAGERARVAAVAKTLQAGEAIVLVAEQDLSSVRTMADRVYGLRDGRVVWSGSAGAPDRAGQFG